MRQKTFEKLCIPFSSTRIWKLQRDAASKQQLKSSRLYYEDLQPSQDQSLRLESSHEITLKYASFIEDRFLCLQKLNNKLNSLLDPNNPGIQPRPNALEELELIRFKDLSRYKEMEVTELRLLEQLSHRYTNKETDFLVLIERIKDKVAHYDYSIKAFDDQIDKVKLQNMSKENEYQAKIQELSAKNDMQRIELEGIKNCKYQISHLKNTIDEMNRSERQNSEKYLQEISRLQDEIQCLRKVQEAVNDQSDSSRTTYKRLYELLLAIKEITHSVFVKYGITQSEWQDPHWKEELESYTEEFGDMLVEIEFLCFMIAKLTSDNNWLVDRLSELGKKSWNEENRTQNRLKDNVIHDLKAASHALKEFEEARDKLMSQFSP